jgi:hypothetical protein
MECAVMEEDSTSRESALAEGPSGKRYRTDKHCMS